MIRPFYLSAFCVLVIFGAFAQTAKPGNMPIAATRKPVNLFLHLDKSIYQPNESIWFTGYILNRNEDVMMAQNTLYVVLIDPVSKSVISQQRFLIRNGIGKGSLALPDSIAAGDYWFLGYTNALLETGDQPIFRQLISVRTGTPSPFRISSTTLQEKGDSLFVRYRIGTTYGGLASGGKFTYTLFDSTRAIATGQKTIDPYGEVLLYFGVRQDTGKYRELMVTIDREKFTQRLFFPIYTGKSLDREVLKPKEDSAAVHVDMVSDSGSYHQRSKVTLHIHIRDQAGRPAPGIFSLSVVASKRRGISPPRTIDCFEHLPEPPPATISELKQIAGEMPDYGYVLKDNGKVDHPVSLALMGNQFAFLETDAKGTFNLPWSVLVASEGETNCLSVAAQSPDRYKVMVYSRADSFNARLASIHYPITTPNYQIAADPEDLVHPVSINLPKTVVVKKTKIAELDYGSGMYNSLHCGDDYVCTHHHGRPGDPDILNCPYMSTNGACELIKPKEGDRYVFVPKESQFERQHGSLLVTYHCAAPPLPPFMKILGPILREKAFSPPCTGEKELTGTGLQSTIYWNHSLSTDSNGEVTVSFFTNNLTGNFNCSLQGVSSAGVITANAVYSVVSSNSIVAVNAVENSKGSGGSH